MYLLPQNKDREMMTYILKKAFVLSIALFLIVAACVEKEEEVGGKQKGKTGSEVIVSIGEILKEPSKFKDSIVTIAGQAEPGLAFEFVNEQPYLLKDSTGQIWVITRGLMPSKGQKIKVRGAVQTPYQIKGRRYEVAIVEIKRY